MTGEEKSKHKMSDQTKNYFTTIIEKCLPRIERATVPIIGIQNDEIKHDRTGILYKIADKHFIISAAHDLYQIVEANIPLYLSMNKPDIMPIPLKAKFYFTEENIQDISVIWLPSETACKVAKHKEFLSHNQIDFYGSESSGPFLFFGYPMGWSGQKVSENYLASQGLAFITSPHDGTCLELADYNHSIHMILDFKREAINCLEGDINKLPKPEGISGCGIWQVSDFIGNEINIRDENSLTLVAIEHGCFSKSNYIKATKIGYAMSLIAGEFPDTKAAMEIIYPKA